MRHMVCFLSEIQIPEGDIPGGVLGDGDVMRRVQSELPYSIMQLDRSTLWFYRLLIDFFSPVFYYCLMTSAGGKLTLFSHS